MKKLAIVFSAVFCLVFSVPACAEEICTFDKAQDGFVQIESGQLNIRERPDETSEIAGLADSGTIVHVESIDDNGWGKVRSGNISGYVAMQYISRGKEAEELISSALVPVASISAEQTAIHAEPSSESDTLCVANEGNVLLLLGADESGTWYKVKADSGEEGFLLASDADVSNGYKTAKPAAYFGSAEQTNGSTPAVATPSFAAAQGNESADNEKEISLQEVDGQSVETPPIVTYDSQHQI